MKFSSQALGDGLQLAVLLQHFTGNVQGQVRGIHQTLDEAEVIRQQVLAVIHNHNAAGVELQPLLKVLGVVVERHLTRDEQQAS